MNDKSPGRCSGGALADLGGDQLGRRSVTHSRASHPVCMATRTRITLALGSSFTRSQLAYLMAQASRWGAQEAYERGLAAGVAQEAERQAELRVAAMLAPEIPWSADSLAHADRVMAHRRAVTEQHSRQAQVPVLATYHGGPVPEWGYDPESAQRAAQRADELNALPPVKTYPTPEWP